MIISVFFLVVFIFNFLLPVHVMYLYVCHVCTVVVLVLPTNY